MIRVKLTIEYDGTNYAGWQRQENALTVQEVLEKALSGLTNERVTVAGASRTDAGVHAIGQVAHFDTESRIPPDKFALAVNTKLPDDIRVVKSERVDLSFHARFSSTGKLYRYVIYASPHKSALYGRLSSHCIYPLDLNLMRLSAKDMVGRHDFKAFAASGSCVKDTVRYIHSCEVERNGDFYVINIAGKGFLYNMVRILAGTLIQIGAGRIGTETIVNAIETGDRLVLGPTAPPEGLTLMKVFYSDGFIE